MNTFIHQSGRVTDRERCGNVVTYCFGGNPKYLYPKKPEVELIVTIAPTENIFNVKYL